MEVVDAKDAFLSWNKKSLDNLIEQYELDQQPALKVLPLLFQTNARSLPGYNGADTPAGIYGYKPEKTVIDAARQFYGKFSYQQEFVLKNTIIESIFLQKNIIDNQLSLWVVHIVKLKSDQIEELRNKLERIITWLKSRNINVSGHLLSVSRLAKKSKPQAVFLDDFYLESYLLAGKYPVWWLVPPEKETNYSEFVEYIKTARFVNEDEFIDIGSLSQLSPEDIIRLSIKYIQMVYQQSETSYLHLLLLRIKQYAWPEINGKAWLLKNKIYSSEKNIEELYAKHIVLELLQKAIDLSSTKEKHLMSQPKMFGLLSKYAKHTSTDILDSLSTGLAVDIRGQEVVDYLLLYKALFFEIKLVYSSIIKQYSIQAKEDNAKLTRQAQNMLAFVSESDGRVLVYNTMERPEFTLNRMLLRHIMKSAVHDLWDLVIELEEGEEKKMQGFSSLLSLISWAWLNRIVDKSTQVSVDCPQRTIKQTEAYHLLEILTRNVNPDLINKTSKRAFEHEPKPLQSLLFLNLVTDESHLQNIKSITSDDDPLSYGDGAENVITNCEQLIVFDWGDAYTRTYTDDGGVLQCLCDWMKYAPLLKGVRPKGLHSFGYGAGESTYLAQRVDQVYDELIQFFYQQKQLDGRFIVKMGNDYYCVEAEENELNSYKVGDVSALYTFLERGNKKFRPYSLERLALAETPLKEIFKRNKKNVVQIFFRVNNRLSETWILDEKGSLWFDQHAWFDRSSLVAHWLYLMRNIRSRLKKINYQNKELPLLEIQEVSSNQLGGLDFSPVGAEAVSAERGFIDIHIKISPQEGVDKMSIICDGKDFDSSGYGDQVITECMLHTAERMIGEGRKPVYVTDINVPLRVFGVEEREDIQTLHFLKYKRNIEKKLNQVLSYKL
jgi:adenylate cyclase, class 1